MRSLKKICGVSFPDVLSVASRECGVELEGDRHAV